MVVLAMYPAFLVPTLRTAAAATAGDGAATAGVCAAFCCARALLWEDTALPALSNTFTCAFHIVLTFVVRQNKQANERREGGISLCVSWDWHSHRAPFPRPQLRFPHGSRPAQLAEYGH